MAEAVQNVGPVWAARLRSDRLAQPIVQPVAVGQTCGDGLRQRSLVAAPEGVVVASDEQPPMIAAHQHRHRSLRRTRLPSCREMTLWRREGPDRRRSVCPRLPADLRIRLPAAGFSKCAGGDVCRIKEGTTRRRDPPTSRMIGIPADEAGLGLREYRAPRDARTRRRRRSGHLRGKTEVVTESELR
jgi:hypothetical protein